jgi:hypothetical protein
VLAIYSIESLRPDGHEIWELGGFTRKRTAVAGSNFRSTVCQ